MEGVTHLTILQPAKVELKGPAEISVTVNTEKTFTCVATGVPKPIRLEWTLGDATLPIDDSQTDLGPDSDLKDQVRQVKQINCLFYQRYQIDVSSGLVTV